MKYELVCEHVIILDVCKTIKRPTKMCLLVGGGGGGGGGGGRGGGIRHWRSVHVQDQLGTHR